MDTGTATGPWSFGSPETSKFTTYVPGLYVGDPVIGSVGAEDGGIIGAGVARVGANVGEDVSVVITLITNFGCGTGVSGVGTAMVMFVGVAVISEATSRRVSTVVVFVTCPSASFTILLSVIVEITVSGLVVGSSVAGEGDGSPVGRGGGAGVIIWIFTCGGALCCSNGMDDTIFGAECFTTVTVPCTAPIGVAMVCTAGPSPNECCTM